MNNFWDIGLHAGRSAIGPMGGRVRRCTGVAKTHPPNRLGSGTGPRGWVGAHYWVAPVTFGRRHAQTESGRQRAQPGRMSADLHQTNPSARRSDETGQASLPCTFTGVTAPVELDAQNLNVCGLRPKCHAAHAVSTAHRVSSASATNTGGGAFPRGFLSLRGGLGSTEIWVSAANAATWSDVDLGCVMFSPVDTD